MWPKREKRASQAIRCPECRKSAELWNHNVTWHAENYQTFRCPFGHLTKVRGGRVIPPVKLPHDVAVKNTTACHTCGDAAALFQSGSRREGISSRRIYAYVCRHGHQTTVAETGRVIPPVKFAGEF